MQVREVGTLIMAERHLPSHPAQTSLSTGASEQGAITM